MIYVCEECSSMTHAARLPDGWSRIEFGSGFLVLYLCPDCEDAARSFWTDTAHV